MRKLARFFATCLLVVSMTSAAFADGDGGATQTPPGPPPPAAQCVMDCSETEASESVQPTEDWSVDMVTAVDLFAGWLVLSIL